MPTRPEEFVTATDLQRDMKRVLLEAEQRPVSVPRPGGTAITIVNRDSWTNATQAHDWLMRAASVMLYILMRVRSQPAEPPTDFSWLKLFDDPDDLRDFIEEFGTALQNATAKMRPWSDVDAVVAEWHKSAIAIADERLQERFDQARDDIGK